MNQYLSFFFSFNLFSEAALTDHTTDSSVPKEAHSSCTQMEGDRERP